MVSLTFQRLIQFFIVVYLLISGKRLRNAAEWYNLALREVSPAQHDCALNHPITKFSSVKASSYFPPFMKELCHTYFLKKTKKQKRNIN